MKLYKFDYNGYGEYWIVMAKDKESALKKLKIFLKNQIENDEFYSNFRREAYKKWKGAEIDVLPPKYNLIEVTGGVDNCEYS